MTGIWFIDFVADRSYKNGFDFLAGDFDIHFGDL
jgi:hypothetical protein